MTGRLIRTESSPRSAGRLRARLLGRLAGMAAGVRQTRRGSFLIMVVGTLALLAVVTIVYVAIGRADTQTSVAALKVAERDDVVEQMRDYTAGIIADDLFDAVPLNEQAEQGQFLLRREAWDYPSSDFSVTVQDFDPTGDGTGTDPFLASGEPSSINYLGDAPYETSNTPEEYYRDRVDWLQLSNIAPDGMPVNLWALRDDPDVDDDGFSATPERMREWLLLLAESPEDGDRDRILYFQDNAELPATNDARPADWFSGQRFSFFPKVDPSFEPNEQEYLLYQYADTDGDGLLDARWFEMLEARDPGNLSAPVIPHLKTDERLRYFWAVRIVDLSGRVNVNTATDGTLEPLREDPIGLYPSAVDLRRLLTLEDFYGDVRMPEIGYEYLEQPNPAGGPQDYIGYDTPTSDGPAWYVAGDRAYDALRIALDTAELPPGPYEQGLRDLTDDNDVNRKFNAVYWDSWKGTGAPFGPSDYYELFAGFGPGGGTGNLSSALGRAFVGDSLFELLAFNGVNNDAVRSPLEAVLGGRGWLDGRDPLLQNYSPLRDNRSTLLERDGRYTFLKGNATFDLDALVAAMVDVRQRLTTVSGARPIRPALLPADPGDPTKADPASLPLTDDDLKRSIEDLFGTTGGVAGQSLFETYADALLPYSGDPERWRWVSNPQYKTLFYGYRGAELALRTAAHMAANMSDAYDTDDRPTKRTVLLRGDQTFRKQDIDGPGGRAPEFPWKLLDLDQDLQNRTSRLGDQNSDVSVPAVNVFGIEAQPFITEAASFIMYTDTPNTKGGDKDWGGQDLDGDGIPEKPFLPSINGDPTAANPDCLFEVLAFQVHNPFDESITLTGDASGGSKTPSGQYYIQYGDKYYKISKVDRQTGVEAAEALTLGPGESRTLYVLSANVQQIEKRIKNAFGTLKHPDPVGKWLDTQVGAEPDSLRISEFDPQTGDLVVPGGEFVSLQSGSESERKLVRLWRIEKPELDADEGGYQVQGLDETSLNDKENDSLVDRMRDPTTGGAPPALDRELNSTPLQAGKIAGADYGAEPSDGDNTGMTITRWGKLSRREDPRADAATDPPRGAIPAYCIESKAQTDSDITNVTDDDGSGVGLKASDFNGTNGAFTVDDALDEQAIGPTPTQLIDTIDQDPQDKDLIKDGLDQNIGVNLDGKAFQGGPSNVPLYVEPHLDNNKFEVNNVSTMRVADLLLPLGIGPHQIPGAADENLEWTTLSEALAFALYYDNPNVGESVYAGAFVPPATASDPETLLDNGFVRYDAFVPFEDDNQNGVFDFPERANRWGLGVPMAATLFDTLTTIPRKFGSLTSPTFGQINVNTVSREAARALPGLSPTALAAPDGSPLWWWTDPDVHDWRSDIATTLVAYRDKQNIFTRDVDSSTPPPVNFRDWWDLTSGTRLAPTAKNNQPPGNNFDTARWGATGITALRGELGFRSLGELALLRDLGYVSADPNYPTPHDIDRLGFDGKAVDKPGVDSVGYGTNKTDDDEIDDDFDERLALASAAMNSSSVRSDIFAVWILMHGYQESDTKNLDDLDPLVPSVARRFLMVVDRSNVITPGEKPRILLFKEVPL